MFAVNGRRTRFNRILPAIFTTVLCFYTFSGSAFGQDLPNPGFEEWTGSGKPAPFDWEEPTGWKSSNGVTEFIRGGVTRSNTAHSGGFSCSLETLNLFGSDVPGVIVNGEPRLDLVNYSVEVMSGGTPISGRPAKLTGYYQFSSTSEEDYGDVLIVLKKYNNAESSSEIIGQGSLRLNKVSSFTAFSVAVEYQSEDQPDSVIVAFFSSDHTAAKAGGILLVDDVALSFDASGVKDSQPNAAGLRVYPNPTSGAVNIELGSGKEGARTIIFYDLLGREVLSERFDGTSTTVDLLLPTGLYAYRVTDGDEEFVGRIVVSR